MEEMETLKAELQAVVEKASKFNDNTEELKAAQARIEALEGKIEALSATRKGASVESTDTEHKTAFKSFVRNGEVEKKYLVEGTGNVGGFLVPDDFRATLYNKLVAASPVRQVATVLQTNAQNILVPTETSQFAASWTAESGNRTNSTGQTFGQVKVDMHEMYVRIPVSNALLEDAAIDLEGWLIDRAAAQFAKLEGAAFVGGNGTGRPQGFTANTAVQALAIETATAGALDADDLIDLFYSLPTDYAANGTWLINRTVLAAIRKMNVNGDYLWAPGFNGQPDTLLGRPVYEAPDMGDTVAEGEYVAAFGDFRAGYVIGDRVAMEVQRDPYSDADKGNTVFRVRRRVGGEVLIPDAIRLLQVKEQA